MDDGPTPRELDAMQTELLIAIQQELRAYYGAGLRPSTLKLDPRQAALLGIEPRRKGQSVLGVPVEVVGRSAEDG